MRLHRDEKIERLRHVPLFAGLGRRELEELGSLADEIDLPSGRVLTREGEVGHEFFIVVDGSVRIERDGKVVNTLKSGDFFGEIALIDGRPRSATAVCATDCHLLIVGHRQFLRLLEDYPRIQLQILRALAERVRRSEPEA